MLQPEDAEEEDRGEGPQNGTEGSAHQEETANEEGTAQPSGHISANLSDGERLSHLQVSAPHVPSMEPTALSNVVNEDGDGQPNVTNLSVNSSKRKLPNLIKINSLRNQRPFVKGMFESHKYILLLRLI